MILVVLGTQERPFSRLLDAVEDAIDSGAINEDVIVQAGFTSYESNKMLVKQMIPLSEFNKLIEDASLVICHAGYGILSTSLEKHKKVICAARSSKYGEHLNDHQFEILNYYANKGYLLPLNDFSKLGNMIQNIKQFTPKMYSNSFANLQSLICNFIDTEFIK